MESILTTFGIDWRLLLVNMVNFGLLLAGLTYFLYKPVLRMLDERRKKIAAGVTAARAAERELAAIAESKAHTLSEAGKEADQIIAAARTAGTHKERELASLGEAQAEARLREAEMEAKDIKERVLQESKQEVAKLIVLGMEKAFNK